MDTSGPAVDKGQKVFKKVGPDSLSRKTQKVETTYKIGFTCREVNKVVLKLSLPFSRALEFSGIFTQNIKTV